MEQIVELRINETYNGFRLKTEQKVEDLKSTAYIFEHEKTGARALYVKNTDENRVFFIAFKTPPHDNCGTPHILEHSVLCGSEKYRVKDPFNELAKGSLNTFLNAMTYPDKTVYPIASTNYSDFKNLKDVYLDAVFNPMIYDKKEIFMQEGWHYGMEKSGGPLSYTGVVYNEMKGALSSPERILDNCIAESLFPNSIYRYESGGDPESIPSLSYEEFLDFHRRYYSPSNSYIYFYGDMDICEELEDLDKNYLSKHERIEELPVIERETGFTPDNRISAEYPKTGDGDGIYYAFSTVAGECTDPRLIIGLSILSYILTETNASPVKRAVVDGGLAEELESWYDSSVLQPAFSFVGKKCAPDREDDFKNTILDTLRGLVENGIDEGVKGAALNMFEFYMREEDFGYRPKGLVYGLMTLKSWLHGASPAETLNRFSLFDDVKNAAADGYFEKLIEKYILENRHNSLAVVYPKEGMQEEIEAAEVERLKKAKDAMSKADIEAALDDNERLERFQQSEDNADALECIPILPISEVDKKTKFDECIQEEKDGLKSLFVQLESNGIDYVKLIFDLSSLPREYVQYAGLLSDLLGRLDTKNYSYEELPNVINSSTGGIDVNCSVSGDSEGGCNPRLVVSGKAFSRNSGRMFELFGEIILNTVFDRKESFINVIKAKKLELENAILNNSHRMAVERSLTYISSEAKYRDGIKGIGYYDFLCKIERGLPDNIEELAEKLKKTASYIFTRENFSVFYGCESRKNVIEAEAGRLYARLSEGSGMGAAEAPATAIENEGIITGGKVVYDAKAFNFRELGYKYSGKMQVIKSIINLEYLWNRVRVSGGAYGCGCNLLRSGFAYFYSYRDPNVEKTFDAFDEAGRFLSEFKPSARDITKFILGTVGGLDRPKTAAERFEESIILHFTGVSREDKQKSRDELLSFKAADIEGFARLFDRAAETGGICVMGNESKIREFSDSLKNIRTLN